MAPMEIIAAAAAVVAGVQVGRLVVTVCVNWRSSQWNEASVLTNPDLDWDERLGALKALGLSPRDQYRLLQRYYGVAAMKRLTAASPRLASLARQAAQGAPRAPRGPRHA